MQEKAADKQKRNDEEERGPLVVKTGIRRARVESVDGDFAETLVQVFGPACLAGDDGAPVGPRIGRLYWRDFRVNIVRLFFDELVASVGGQPSAGNHLKSTSGWFKKGNGSNEFGFAAFPAGLYNGEKFDGIGGYAYFWSATESTEEPGFAYYLYLDFSNSAAKVNAFVKGDARSVRCYR